MIKGLVITTPAIGRISIGGVNMESGKPIPFMNDHFELTKLSQQDGKWDLHPLHSACLKVQQERFWTEKEKVLRERNASQEELDAERAHIGADQKLREIPVRLLYDDPALSMSSSYTAFDRDGRPVCIGDGENYTRRIGYTKETGHCPGADFCKFGADNRCQALGRLQLKIEGQSDELGVFVQRTCGWNTIRTLTARINNLHALTGGKIAELPLSLKVAAKSTSQSYMRPITFLDLRVRDGYSLATAVSKARQCRQEWEDLGIDRSAFEEAARQGLANGSFTETEEDGITIVQEFYPERMSTQLSSKDKTAYGVVPSNDSEGKCQQRQAGTHSPAVTSVIQQLEQDARAADEAKQISVPNLDSRKV